jgi:hypothetical protein
MDRGNWGGKERGGKETDGCPLIPICEGHLTTLHLLPYHTLSTGHCMSRFKIGQCPVYAHWVVWEVWPSKQHVEFTRGEECATLCSVTIKTVGDTQLYLWGVQHTPQGGSDKWWEWDQWGGGGLWCKQLLVCSSWWITLL